MNHQNRLVVAMLPAVVLLVGPSAWGAESASAGVNLALPGTGSTLDLSADPIDEPFLPDQQSDPPELPARTVPVSTVDAYDKVSVPVPTNGAQGTFFVSIARNKAGSPEETRGRIYHVSLSGNDAQLVWDQPAAVRVLGHDVATGKTLIVDNLDHFQRGGELVMVEGLATGQPQPLYRRTLPGAGKPGFAPQVEWARLLGDSQVLAIVDRVLHLWDLPAATLIYRVEGVSATEPPVLSANQQYLAVPQDGKVVILDTLTGQVRRSISTGGTLKPGVAFHPEGQLLAACFSNQYQVWDCVTQNVVSEATTTEHLGSHPVNWIAPKMFRAALGDAVELDLGMSVWKYSATSCTEPLVVGGKLVTATTSRECALVSVAVPHASAEKSVRQLMSAGDAAMLVRPGSSVAIAVEASVDGVDSSEITQALSDAAQAAGWKVSERAPITLVAKIGRGEKQELRFRSLGSGPRTQSTASLTPFTAELEIRRGANVLWTRSTSNQIPSLLRLQEGETVQDAVNRYERPDSGFFSRLNLPPRIPKPEISGQIGRSILKDGEWQDLGAAGSRPPTRRLPRRRR